jgi:hypothetical protein
MDEQEFDSVVRQPFGTKDAMRQDARWRRCATLAGALFGRTPDNLRRQLLKPYPEIPSGFDLTDLRELEGHVRMVLSVISSRAYSLRMAGLSPWLSHFASAIVIVGTRRFTVWEACCEIIRHAIEHLENH